MIFSSIFFLCIFLPVTLILYYAVPVKYKNLVLLILSLVFYAWGEPVYVLLMIFSIAFNYMAGLQMGYLGWIRYKRRRKRIFIFTVAVNLAILGFFKYFDFFLSSINGIFGSNIPLKNIALPIGISFYTFQILSYVVDVYREKVPVQRNVIDFGAYITMFPQLIAGPIVRYEDIMHQLNKRRFSVDRIADGAAWLVKGLSKKVLLANNIGALYEALRGISVDERAVFSTWLMAAAFTFQIYFDFSGYSDMAVGMGKMLGFDFVQNFDHPYLSTSITQFWRKWHISLGTWFREYVYIPLGGNRCSEIKNIRNIMIVWMLTGLWHGAAWNFIIWGLYYGALLVLEKFVLYRFLERLPSWIRHIYSLVLIVFGWMLFSVSDMKEMGELIASGFGGFATAFIDRTCIYYLTTNVILLALCIFCSGPAASRILNRICFKFGNKGQIAVAVLYCLMFIACIAYLVDATYNPFLYFRF